MSTSNLDRSRTSRLRARVVALSVAVVAPLIVWIGASAAGLTLSVPSPLVGSLTIDGLLVFVTALLVGLAAWAALLLIERRAARPQRVWTTVSTAVLIVSLPPLLFLGAPVATKVALALMHLACGLPLILLLGKTADRPEQDAAPAAGGVATADGETP
jgi:hypothetical protein